MKPFVLSILLFSSLVCHGPALADDQDAARAARERGVTVPFEQILAAARATVSTRTDLLDATLLPNADRQLVEVFLRERTGGQIVSVVVDGRTAEIVSVSGRAAEGRPASRSDKLARDPWQGVRSGVEPSDREPGEARGKGPEPNGRSGDGRGGRAGQGGPGGGRGDPGGPGGGRGKGGARP